MRGGDPEEPEHAHVPCGWLGGWHALNLVGVSTPIAGRQVQFDGPKFAERERRVVPESGGGGGGGGVVALVLATGYALRTGYWLGCYRTHNNRQAMVLSAKN